MKKLIIIAVAAIVTVGVGAGGYFVFLSSKSDQEIFEAAARDSLFSDDDYTLNLEVSAEDFVSTTTISLSSDGQPQQSTNNLKVLSADSFEMDIDTIATDPDTGYQRINKVTPKNQLLDETFARTFDPVIGVWTKLEADDETEDQPEIENTFDDLGPQAASGMVYWFMPISAGVNDGDRQMIYNQIVDSEFYTVEDITDTTRDGQAVREARVGIARQALIDMYDMTDDLDLDEESWTQLRRSFINNLYGANDTLWADVYLNADESRIIGVDMNVDLAKDFTDSTFSFTFDYVKTSIFIDDSGDFSVETPDDYIEYSEYEALLEQGAEDAGNPEPEPQPGQDPSFTA